jgi:hypothetical protein
MLIRRATSAMMSTTMLNIRKSQCSCAHVFILSTMFPQLWKTCCVGAVYAGDDAKGKHEGDYTFFLHNLNLFRIHMMQGKQSTQIGKNQPGAKLATFMLKLRRTASIK